MTISRNCVCDVCGAFIADADKNEYSIFLPAKLRQYWDPFLYKAHICDACVDPYLPKEDKKELDKASILKTLLNRLFSKHER